MGPSIHEITHKEVVCVWTLASHFEQLLQVIELSVNVSTNLEYEKVFSNMSVVKKSKFPRRQK